MNTSRLIRFALTVLAMSVPIAATAHELRPAYLQMTQVYDGFHILWKQPVVQNAPLSIEPVFADDCEITELAPPEVSSVAWHHHWQTGCDLSQSTIYIDGLSTTHTDVLVRLETLDGETASLVLRPTSPELDLRESDVTSFAYFVIGIEHLVFGIDHVLFVIGLFLFIRAPIALIKTITAFTVSHSITLALTVMELVRLDPGPVEAVIALSILFLARELVQDESKRSRLTLGRPWVMAFIFGLLHGLGFAGALADIGLPEDDLWFSLLLFNVGIEVGQIAVILVLAAIAWLLARVDLQRHFNTTAAWAMGCAAAFWTIDRTYVLVI